MKKMKNFYLVILGTMCTAAGVGLFLTPNKIVNGGVSGIGTILYNVFQIPMGGTYIALNMLFLLLGLRILGKTFVLKTLMGAGILSVFVEIFTYLPPLTDNILIAAIFGGFLYGLGIGIVFSSGATTGGTDILGRLLQYKFSTLPIGKLMLVIDGIIVLSSALVFDDSDLVFFGLISMVISTYVIDMVIRKLNVSKIAFVITAEGRAIAKRIVTSSPRGVTLLHAIGAYTDTDKNVLFCAMKEGEIEEFQKKVLEIDPHAFVVFAESQQILGNGFYIYR